MTPALQKHALAVEAAMRHFAAINGEDPEIWGAVGLLHDLDYEKFPEEHCRKEGQIMRERGIARNKSNGSGGRREIGIPHCHEVNHVRM